MNGSVCFEIGLIDWFFSLELELDCGLFSGGNRGKGDRFESKEELFACRIEYIYVYLYVCVMIE